MERTGKVYISVITIERQTSVLDSCVKVEVLGVFQVTRQQPLPFLETIHIWGSKEDAEFTRHCRVETSALYVVEHAALVNYLKEELDTIIVKHFPGIGGLLQLNIDAWLDNVWHDLFGHQKTKIKWLVG